MKKIIMLVLLSLCVLCLALGLTACKKHTHELGEWIEQVDPTCDKEGTLGHYHCDGCGMNFDKDGNELADISISTIAHTWTVGEVTKPASCTEEGVRTRTCSVCGATDTQAIDKLPHTPEIVVGVPQTDCTVAGLTNGSKCSVCGETLEAQQVIPAKGHTWDEWAEVSKPTETTSGLQTRACKVCGQVDARYTDLLEHEWSKWTDNGDGTHTRTCANADCAIGTQTISCIYGLGAVTAATCTEDGYTLYTCTICGHVSKQEEVNALGHDYGDWTADYVGVENADNHTHTHTHICRRCNNSETESCKWEAMHVVLPTCTTGGYTYTTCVDCGSLHEFNPIAATGHNWSEFVHDAGADTHTRTCYNEGCLEKTETLQCVYTVKSIVHPTCDEGGYTLYVCSDCQDAKHGDLTVALDHAWGALVYDGDDNPADDATHTHSRVCSRCRRSEQEECNIVSTDNIATCVTGGSTVNVCKDCLMSFSNNATAPLGHQWGAFTDNGDGYHRHTCERCSATEKFSHNYTSATVSVADCVNPSVVKYTCVDCNKTYNENVGTALGHKWSDWEILQSTHKRTCQNDPAHVEEKAHVWTTTNLCDACSYDALTYTLIGGHYVVSGDNNLSPSVVNIIIGAYHKELGSDTAYMVVEIGKSAFESNSYIQTVQLPESLQLINIYAFHNCTALKSVTINGQNSELKTIDSGAFYGCKSLVGIEIPASVSTIGPSAFRDCEKLEEISIGDTVTSIGVYAFHNTAYYNLANNWTDGVLYIGKHLIKAKFTVSGEYQVKDGTLSIGYTAFSECADLTKITLPASLGYVERDAFLGCTALNEVVYNGDFRGWFGITFVNDFSSPLYYAGYLNITEAHGDITIPDGVKSIPAGTFRGTDITSVSIPDSVTYIGEEAFMNCSKLETINIPDSVIHIGADALTGSKYFNDATHWDSNGMLYIGHHLIASKPSDVTGAYAVKAGTLTIAANAFKNCTSLTQVTIASSVTRIGAGVFDGCADTLIIIFEDSDSVWFASIPDSISRQVKAADISGKSSAKTLFNYYPGDWRRIS